MDCAWLIGCAVRGIVAIGEWFELFCHCYSIDCPLDMVVGGDIGSDVRGGDESLMKLMGEGGKAIWNRLTG